MNKTASNEFNEQYNYSLKGLNSWRIGGNAERLYRPNSCEELQQYLQYLPNDCEVTFLGLGSNMLIRDGGVDGSVVLTRDLNAIDRLDTNLVSAQAGVSCAKFARYCVNSDFPDGAFFAGIPGTIGGALRMNAGAFGGETWNFVEKLHVINRQGLIFTRSKSDYNVGYRSIEGKDFSIGEEYFIGAEFKFVRKSVADPKLLIKELLRKRSTTQPIGTLSCGSVFRNPDGAFAAQLIDECGLKGLQIGGAVVSPLHANFIINIENALAADIEQLISHIRGCVDDKFGLQLETEVKIIGKTGSDLP